MKPKHFSANRRLFALATVALPTISQSLCAASIFWANTGTNFNAGASWTGGNVPGTADLATFVGAKTTDPALSAPASIRGVLFSNAAASSYVISGSALTLGNGGINASAVTSGTNTITAGLSLGAGGATWTTGAGSILALNPTSFSRSAGATVNINTLLGSGTISTSTLTNTNGILGPWASVRSAGSTANNSAAGDTYATVSGGNIIPYTTATASTANTALGGNIPSGGAGTVNYDLSGVGTLGPFGLARNVNTIRYTASGARQPGNTANADLLTFNGFMNAGTGTFTFGTLGDVANDRPYNVLVGAGLNMVLDARSADITMLSTIKNNAGGASAVTITGNNTVIFSRANSYTGATTVAGGTLLVNGTGSINTSNGLTINGANAKYIHTATVASTVPLNLIQGTLDGTGSVGAVTVAGGLAATIANGNGTSTPLTAASLSFGGAATVNLSHNGTTPLAVTGALATTPANGQVILNLPGTVPNGTLNLISFGSFGGSASDFTANFSGLGQRQTAGAVQVSGNNIAVTISGESIAWTGTSSDPWETIASGDNTGPNNWVRETAQSATNFWASDSVLFNDTYNLGSGNVAVTQGDVTISTSVSPGSTTFNNSSVAYVIDSLGSGISTGSLTKNGTAVTTLVGTHSYTGITTINAGTLQLGSDFIEGTIGNSASVVNNGTLRYLSNSGQTAPYPISGSGGLVKDGAANLNLTGANTSTGSTTINSGTITVTGGGGLGSGALTVASGANLNLNKTITLAQTTTGAGVITNTAGTTNLNGDLTGFSGIYRHSSAGSSTVINSTTGSSEDAAYEITIGNATAQGILAGVVSGTNTFPMGSLSGVTASLVRNVGAVTGTNTFEIGNLGFNSEFAGTFGGGGGTLALTKVGDGILTLSGPCTYTGATAINAGTLRFTSSAKNLATSAFTLADGATLEVQASAANATTLTNASLTIGASSLVFDFNNLNPTSPQIATGALTVNGAVSVELLNGNLLTSGTYKLIDYASITGSGSFPGGSFPVGNRGTGSIVNNAIDASIDLVIATDVPLWTGLDSGEWTAGSTGTNKNWKLSTANTATDYIDQDAVLFDDTATGTTNISIPTGVSPLSTTFSNSTLSYTVGGSGGINTGSLVKNGSGTTTLLTVNNYTGTTTINGGTLALGAGGTDGSISSSSAVTNNGTLAYQLAADQSAPYPISGTGNLTKSGTGTLTLSGTHTYSGGTTLSGGAINLIANGSLGTGSIAIGTGTTLNINKNLPLPNTVTGNGNIVNTGNTTVSGNFSGFSGTFTHNTSVVSAGFTNATATSAAASYVIASDQGSTQGMIASGNGDYTLQLGSLSGVANSLFRGGNTATGLTTLEIGALNTDTEFAGLINNGVTKSLALTKVGTGSLTLSGNCGYSGATLVNAGTLRINGSLTTTPLVTVQPSATLSGSGSITNGITASGIVAPGALTPGTLTTGAATLNGTLAIEIDGPAGDKLVSTGAINLSSTTLTVQLLGGGFTEASYVIAEGTSITGSFGTVPPGYTVNIISGGPGQQAVLTSTGGSGYSSWAATNADGGDPDQDFDLDGVKNGVEYFLNSPAGFTANPQITAGAITWTNGGNIPASAYGTEFKIQTSTNLAFWTDVPVGNLSNNTDGPEGALTYTLPTGEDSFFIRLVVIPD